VSLGRIGILAALVAALGVYLYVYELPKVEEEIAGRLLVDAVAEDVTGLQVTFPDRTITLERHGDAWTLTQPIVAPADATQVRSLVSALTGAKIDKTLDDLPGDLGDFGLAPPDPVVRLTVGTAPPVELRIGRTTAIGSKTYVQVGDEKRVHLTHANLRPSLDKQPKDLRDKQLLDFQTDDVTRVVIGGHERESVTLQLTKPNTWVVEPGDLPADLAEVRSYLSSLRSARAVDFVDDAPADLATYGLDHPRLSIAVHANEADTANATLSLGGERKEGDQTQVYAKAAGKPTVVVLGQWALTSLDKTAAEFRDKTLLAFDQDRIGEIAFQRNDATGFLLRRGSDGTWTAEGVEAKPDQEAVNRLLADLRDLKGADIVAEEPSPNLATWGLDAPTLRIGLSYQDDQATGTVLATKDGDKYYTTLEGSDLVYETRDYMYTRLDKTLEDVVPDIAPPPAAAGAAPAP
jgi:Domain of unknown function (DUF4340)